MKPIHDRAANLVAWFDGNHVFDLRLEWVAFHRDGQVFGCTPDVPWLGPLRAGSFLDRSGRVFAWLAGSVPAGQLAPSAPMRPVRPLPPRRPLFPPVPPHPGLPAAPVGGWSELAWLEWLRRAPPPAPAPVEPAAEASPESTVEQPAPPAADGATS